MVRDGKATSFDIMISEDQRVALLDMISDNFGRPGFEVLEGWIEMLDELPTVELEHPNVTHGFCL